MSIQSAPLLGRFSQLLTGLLCGVMAISAVMGESVTEAEEKVWPLRFGVDDAGGPFSVRDFPWAAEMFSELGFDLWVSHFLPPAGRWGTQEQLLRYHEEQGIDLNIPGFEDTPRMAMAAHYIRDMEAFCQEHGLHWIINLESANWIESFLDDKGRDWFRRDDGRQYFKFPPELIAELADTENLLGLMYDEAEHMQSTSDPERAERHGIAGLGRPFMYDPAGDVLTDAADGLAEAAADARRVYEDTGLSLYTEHVFPIMFHPFARAGYVAAPKILKESWSPIVIAQAMGAAIQYDTELWITPDLWFPGTYPGHSVEEYRSALLLAYHMGADCIYTENLAFDHNNQGIGSLILYDDDRYEVTPYGEVTKWFIHDYVPAHPRHYSFRELKPRIAIIRQEDGCYGQATAWLPDTLFGHPEWQSTLETEAWFKLWHLLSLGVVPADTLSWHAGSMARRSYQVFAPLDGVVVFDHHVRKKHFAEADLIILTGIGVSEATLADVAERVREGAVCIGMHALLPESVQAETGENGSFEDGAGRWIATTDFLAPHVRQAIIPFLPQHDRIRYRFGDHEVHIRPIDDDLDRLEASVHRD